MKFKLFLTAVALFGGILGGIAVERLTRHHDQLVLCNSSGHCATYEVTDRAERE